MSDRVSLKLGSLAEPIREAARKSGRNLSEEIRHRLAKSLGIKAPEIEVGNPDIGSMSKAGVRARWGGR